MDLKEFAGVDSLYRDIKTGQKVEWHEYMHRVISKLGIENIKPYIPFSQPMIQSYLLKGDIHLNDLPMYDWDRAAGFKTGLWNRASCVYVGGGITNLFLRNKITTFSCADGVCVLKETARILYGECGPNGQRNTL